jgi:hypothetical protein
LLAKALRSLPGDERCRYFAQRRRPHRSSSGEAGRRPTIVCTGHSPSGFVDAILAREPEGTARSSYHAAGAVASKAIGSGEKPSNMTARR